MRRYEPIAGIVVGAAGADSTIPVPTQRRQLLGKLYAPGVVAAVTVYGADIIDGIQFYVGTRLITDVTAQELLAPPPPLQRNNFRPCRSESPQRRAGASFQHRPRPATWLDFRA